MRNAVAAPSPGGGWRLAKGKARKPMDAAVALAMCVYLLVQERVPEPVSPQIFIFSDDN